MRTKVRFLEGKKLPPEMLKMKAGNDPDLEKQTRSDRGESKMDDELKSPAANYGNYHLQHSSKNERGSGTSPTERLLKRLGDVWTQMETLGNRRQQIMQELSKSKDLTVNDVFQKLDVDLLEDVIGVIQKVVVGIIGSFSDLILLLADGLNNAFNIPVLSPLYNKLTGGADLTMLDALCLCLARLSE